MKYFTTEQHQEVLAKLVKLARTSQGVHVHPAGLEYTSLMSCFFLHNLSAAESLLRLSTSFGNKWFPVSVGYTIVRTLFETDVTAHFVTQDPAKRSVQYIKFGDILNKWEMEACRRNRTSKKSSWREAMNIIWENHWTKREEEINEKYKAALPKFQKLDAKGKLITFQNWSGKSIRQLAKEVDHFEAYEIFYSELSSFSHIDIHLADQFLKVKADGPVWTQRADDHQVGDVFRYSITFMTCFLDLMADQF